MNMQTRILGKDLRVSAVGFGCMGISHAYGQPLEKSEAIELLRAAAEEGYTLFDTAECYIGENSDNEEIVGEALAPFKGKVKIATKFGIKHEGRQLITDSRPEKIRLSVEGSLKRLKTDCIDLYYQHRVDPKVPAEEVAETMSRLMDEGKIRHWGISETDEEYLRRAHAVCNVTAIQNRYSMMYRDYEKMFPVLEELNVGFVAFSPLANGFLSAAYTPSSAFGNLDYRKEMPQFQKNAYDENAQLLKLIESIAREKDATPSQVALGWLIAKKPYIVPIPGTTKIARMRENAAAASLTKEQTDKISAALENMKISDVFGGHKIKK